MFREIFGDIDKLIFLKYKLFLNDQNFAWDEHADQCVSYFLDWVVVKLLWILSLDLNSFELKLEFYINL